MTQEISSEKLYELFVQKIIDQVLKRTQKGYIEKFLEEGPGWKNPKESELAIYRFYQKCSLEDREILRNLIADLLSYSTFSLFTYLDKVQMDDVKNFEGKIVDFEIYAQIYSDNESCRAKDYERMVKISDPQEYMDLHDIFLDLYEQ